MPLQPARTKIQCGGLIGTQQVSTTRMKGCLLTNGSASEACAFSWPGTINHNSNVSSLQQEEVALDRQTLGRGAPLSEGDPNINPPPCDTFLACMEL